MGRCPLCPNKHTCVPPDGPEDSPQYFIGEAPGGDEDRKGRCFVGRTGQEVDRGYLPLAGLRRSSIYMDNAISCFPDRPKGKLDPKRKSDLDLLQSCAEHHLYPVLERARPSLIVPMGSFACRSIDPSIDLELQHGIPVATPWGQAFPMYHPAVGMYEPKKMLLLRNDWTRLRKLILGRLRLPVDQFAGREQYTEVESPAHLRSILDGCNDYIMGCDTESYHSGGPFCLTFSIQGGTGYLIRAEAKDILAKYQTFLDRWQGYILWHNWLWDGVVVKAMGLRFPRRLIRDTMVVVFHLGNLPQGLKALSYRELGMRMQDFDDLVTPHSAQHVIEYLHKVMMEEWPDPEPVMERTKGVWAVRQPQNLSAMIRRQLKFQGKEENSEKLFDAWDNWEECHEMVENVCGNYPGKCISHVPFDQALFYACRDADALLRLWPLLDRMSKNVRKKPQEMWQEVA